MADVVALHGFSDSSACWGPFLTRLGLPARTPDLVGHGGRAMPAGVPFSHEVLVEDVLPVVEATATESGRPVVLLGHSLGASTAAGVAARAPHLVAMLVLEDPPWQPPASAAADQVAERANPHRPWLEGLQGTDHAGRRSWVEQRHPDWPTEELDPWAQSKAVVDLALFDAEQQWLRRSWGRVADRVRCPTLLVVGDPRLGAACDPAVARTLARRPGWLVVAVSGAGHDVRRDRPALLADLLRGLLRTYRP